MPSENVVFHPPNVALEERARVLGQRGCAVWLTGLSGAGKSTIAYAAESLLLRARVWAFVLDGDNLRHGLNADLGFTPADRAENVRRLAEVARLFADAGAIVFVSAVSPFRADRQAARERVGDSRFVEVFIDAPLEVCEKRDPKQLYGRARAGMIENFTGISAPYEKPEEPELVLSTADSAVDECAARLVGFLRDRCYIPPSGASG